MNIPNPKFYGIFTNDPDHQRFEAAKAKGYDVRHVDSLIPDRHNHRICVKRLASLRPGDIVHRTFYQRYQHGFTVEIKKVNKKTIHAIEICGSYGAGSIWTIRFPEFPFEDPSYKLALEHMTTERINEIVQDWHSKGI